MRKTRSLCLAIICLAYLATGCQMHGLKLELDHGTMGPAGTNTVTSVAPWGL
jgi:hypothetical protein